MLRIKRHVQPKLDDVTKYVSIVTLAQRSVELIPAGSVYKALCPFHRDKDTPSLVVYPHTNSWVCFSASCGGKRSGRLNGGSVIDWVMQLRNVEFLQAIDWLRDTYGPVRDMVELPVIPGPKPAPVASPALPVPLATILYWGGMLSERPDKQEYFYKRGFTDETIERECWGWTGERFSIPVWEGKPLESICLGARLRRDVDGEGPKYIGLAGSNPATVWGRYHCQAANLALGFAGELDAARAVQDGFAAFSVVNGVGALGRFPRGWPDLWFPDTDYIVVVFDKKEEADGGRLAQAWSAVKGSMHGRVFHWPPTFDGKDYCDWRDSGATSQEFWALVQSQLSLPYAHRRV